MEQDKQDAFVCLELPRLAGLGLHCRCEVGRLIELVSSLPLVLILLCDCRIDSPFNVLQILEPPQARRCSESVVYEINHPSHSCQNMLLSSAATWKSFLHCPS